MAKTDLAIVNAGLKEIGEAEVSALTSTNRIHEALLEQIQNDVRMVLERYEYRWGLQRTILKTTDDITTETVSVTNGDATVTSTDDDGNDADNFGSVTTSMWFRKTSDYTSYKVSSVDTASSPDTVELETTYEGTTSTSSGYRFFQDTYSITSSTFDRLIRAQYGEGRTYLGPVAGIAGTSVLTQLSFQELMDRVGGDLHRDTSGKPLAIAEIGRDSSDQRQYVLWPFPQDVYIIELWHTIKYAETDGTGTTIFGADAPDIAYDVVEAGCQSRACLIAGNTRRASYWEETKKERLDDLTRRENRAYQSDAQMCLSTGRTDRFRGIRGQSINFFETRGAIRS